MLTVVAGQGKPVRQREHQAAAAGQPDGADRIADVEPGMRAGGRIERVHVAGKDVHPAEQAPASVPDRPFGQFALSRNHDLRVEPPGHPAIQSRAALARPQELTRRAVNLIFVTILLGILVSALDQTVVSTALPTIVGDLGRAGHVCWVATSYILTDTIATVLAGKLGDLFGRKWVFQVSMVIFIVGPRP